MTLVTRHYIRFVVAFCCAGVIHATGAAEITASFSFPKSIGELSFDKIREPTEDSRSTQVVYRAPDMTLTLIIFGGDSELPDGIESERFKAEFEKSKMAVLDPRAWDKAKLLREGIAELGTAPRLVPAREASFKITDDGTKSLSYLYLAASNRVFFKVRYTVSRKRRESGEMHLPLIRSAVGQLITNFAEKQSDAA